jgi:hypothetical protein
MTVNKVIFLVICGLLTVYIGGYGYLRLNGDIVRTINTAGHQDFRKGDRNYGGAVFSVEMQMAAVRYDRFLEFSIALTRPLQLAELLFR